MRKIFDPMTKIISLHGLGFIQVVLGGKQRLHVWHPALPRRSCSESSAIHSHSFSFKSTVLVGEQNNIRYTVNAPNEHAPATHDLYLHRGPRTDKGNRPWENVGQVHIQKADSLVIRPGETYTEFALDYHKTVPGGDGRVATLMTKTCEGEGAAHSSCLIGVAPDVDFDRFQWTPNELWAMVIDVLGSHQILEKV